MEITEVRIKLMAAQNDKLRAFCSITIDDDFVIRDLKVIEGSKGPFVAMPSRKLTEKCPRCGGKNHYRANYCNDCAGRLDPERPATDAMGRPKLHADIAHPINQRCREVVQQRILDAYVLEREKAKNPNYQPPDLDVFDEAYLSEDASGELVSVGGAEGDGSSGAFRSGPGDMPRQEDISDEFRAEETPGEVQRGPRGPGDTSGAFRPGPGDTSGAFRPGPGDTSGAFRPGPRHPAADAPRRGGFRGEGGRPAHAGGPGDTSRREGDRGSSRHGGGQRDRDGGSARHGSERHDPARHHRGGGRPAPPGGHRGREFRGGREGSPFPERHPGKSFRGPRPEGAGTSSPPGIVGRRVGRGERESGRGRPGPQDRDEFLNGGPVPAASCEGEASREGEERLREPLAVSDVASEPKLPKEPIADPRRREVDTEPEDNFGAGLFS